MTNVRYEKINNVPYVILEDDDKIIKMDIVFDKVHLKILMDYYKWIAEATDSWWFVNISDINIKSIDKEAKKIFGE